jgi:ABC-type Fe3+/spermidine/putrescine transport system ATPase subunit
VAFIELENLSKRYDQPAVIDISLSIKRGNILCLLGPSGCGKTTLLRLVAGLEKPDTGRVIVDGVDVTGLPPHRRQFGLMFQEFALFPHKSVSENVAFGPSMQNQSPERVRQRTEEMLTLAGLGELADRNVADLSGGERQRVALARSLAPRPRLLMLDEPLGALDRGLRDRLLGEIREILKQLDMTAIFVTHDQSEALAIADRIAVLNNGRLEQIDPPEALYMHPGSVFVARFLGFKNLLEGHVTAGGGVETSMGVFYPSPSPHASGKTVNLVLRPEGARLAGCDSGTDDRLPSIAGRVGTRFFSGQSYRITVIDGRGEKLVFDLPNEPAPPPAGGKIRLNLLPSSMVLIE